LGIGDWDWCIYAVYSLMDFIVGIFVIDGFNLVPAVVMQFY